MRHQSLHARAVENAAPETGFHGIAYQEPLTSNDFRFPITTARLAAAQNPETGQPSHRRHHELRSLADAGGPTAGDRLEPRIEAHTLGAMHVMIAKE